MNKSQKSKSGVLFVISAPSGGGKSTLVSKALPILQKQFLISRVVTYTTRGQRPGEIHGQDYQFVTYAEFMRLQNENFFTEVTEYHDNLYGSPRDFLDQLALGQSFIAITDRNGVAFYQNLVPAAVCIWIAPPSLKILAQRLTARRSESSEALQQRLQLAEEEMLAEYENPLCGHHILNDDIDDAVTDLVDAISENMN